MNPVALFADAGPGPLIIPIVGGLGAAGVFGAAAVVAGGFWLAGGPAAPRARGWFLVSAGVIDLAGAGLFAVMGLFDKPWIWVGAASLLANAVQLFRAARRPGAVPVTQSAAPPPPSGEVRP